MRGKGRVVVESGCELRIGPGATCDIVVSLPQRRAVDCSTFAFSNPVFASVSCNEEEDELLLTIIPHLLCVYVNGAQVLRRPRPMRVFPGAFVSFWKLCPQTTFRFFTPATLPVERPVPEITSTTTISEAPVKGRIAPALSLPFRLLRGKFEKVKSPRSKRPVRITTPFHKRDAQPVLTLYESGSSLAAGKTLDVLPADSAGSAFTHAAVPCLSESDLALPPSSHIVAPFVVEVVDECVTIHTIMRQSNLISSDPDHSSELTCRGTTAKYKPESNDPYVTFHGYDVLERVRYMRVGTPVHSAASSVLECIDGAYSSRECTFMPFPQHSKKMLLKHFLLLAEHTIFFMLTSPLTIRRRSPILCCGDIHGSFADLKFIADSVMPFRHWSLMTMSVLFLGDYVDRGLHDVEVVLYLLAWQALCPETVIILRGNHEDEDVNGDMKTYGDSSFRKKCWDFFGKHDGEMFWKRANDVFATLPLMAIIDDTVFACHGGIPLLRTDADHCDVSGREKEPPHEGQQKHKEQKLWNKGREAHGTLSPASVTSTYDDSIPHEDLLRVLMSGEPDDVNEFRFRCVMPDNHDNESTAQYRSIARELLWNDPASFSVFCDTPLMRSEEENEGHTSEKQMSCHVQFDLHGFRSNIGRGDETNTIREFSVSALKSFMKRLGFTLLIRAHQQKMAGLEMSFSGRVITLFSCCNYLNDTNSAGACLIMNGEVRPISWCRTVVSHDAERTSKPLWSCEGPGTWGSDSFSESLCSTRDNLMNRPPVPSYVGSAFVRVG
ncbi:protein phosphatase [Trypanosoma rangeli SC58]|uniref:Serine/threonine-protein phosphatase n=1 Tax=Trypanosoma rangeli SC58 TaxID=429131 RepID=A0A061J4S0_TRYRA|nr:protein phosphatase [Trypanosoma rangeli SC58]